MRGARLFIASILAAGMIVASPRLLVAQGTLATLRSDVRAPNSPSPPKKPKKKRCGHRHDCGCHHDNHPHRSDLVIAEPVAYIGGAIVTSPWWGPPVAVGDDYSEPGYFMRYPYAHHQDGFMQVGPQRPIDLYDWSIRVRAEYADDFSGLSRVGGRLLWENVHRFGVDTEWNLRSEHAANVVVDQLWTGDVNVVFRFAQSHKLQMRSGLGVNWMSDDSGADLGFNFTYGGDWFPTDPFVVSAEVDLGKLGRATLFHGRVTAGVQYHRVEFFLGYDYFDVGDAQIDGLVSGARFWY